MFDYLLWRARSTSTVIWSELPASVALGDPARRRISFGSTRRQAAKQRLDGAALHELTEEPADWYSLDTASPRRGREFCFVTGDEIAAIGAGSCDVELHTHRHKLPIFAEFDENRARIATKELNHFCYPSGVYTTNHVRWLSETPVQSATACDLWLTKRTEQTLIAPPLGRHPTDSRNALQDLGLRTRPYAFATNPLSRNRLRPGHGVTCNTYTEIIISTIHPKACALGLDTVATGSPISEEN